jgi:threonine dehydratase
VVTLADIEAARARMGDRIERTPCAHSSTFLERTGIAGLYFKLENLQYTGSFKARGALNKLLTLTETERALGVIAASAGNHAQGVAWAAGKLGVAATIVMPERTPLIKVSNTQAFGAQVILYGSNYDEAQAEAARLQALDGRVFVHPFNDPLVIAGQGTVGLELLEQMPHVDMVVTPIGGGGVAAGIAVAIKALRPEVSIIGVQSAAVPSMQSSLRGGAPIEVPAGTTVADGIAVRRPGSETFELCRAHLDRVVTVDDEEIANAILVLLEREKTVVEGAGAVGLAAVLNGHIPEAKGKQVAVVLTGGNIDVNLISRIIERGLVKAGRLVRLTVMIPDRPGALARFTKILADGGANVVEIYHNRLSPRASLGDVNVEVRLETRGRPHIDQLLGLLEQQGLQAHEES